MLEKETHRKRAAMLTWTDSHRAGKLVASSAKVGRFKLDIHRVAGAGRALYLSCHGVFWRQDLNTRLMSRAKVVAVEKLMDVVFEASRDIIDNDYRKE